jgi:hypothetical protein
MISVNVELSIFVSYAQISVFLPSLVEPFNSWTDEDVKNGFSWRPGSASFLVPDEAGQYRVQIHTGTQRARRRDGSEITVPFEIPADGLIEVGSISDTKIVKLEAGAYDLTFEMVRSAENARVAQLWFGKR